MVVVMKDRAGTVARIVIGVVIVTLQAVGVNRFANLNTPIWSPRRQDGAQP